MGKNPKKLQKEKSTAQKLSQVKLNYFPAFI